jgi:glycosyltransferase involved in cell wall biosynthesis
MGAQGTPRLRCRRPWPGWFVTSSLRIAFVKPEWGIRGGFELVVDRLVRQLSAAGHDVMVVWFDAWKSDHRPFGRRVPDEAWARAPEFFTFLAQVESCRKIDVGRADLVVSTQPPTYVVDHPRHLSLFFHHARMFNDLSPYMIEAGLVDPEVHAAAGKAIRAIDNEALGRVKQVAAGSETVARRLHDFNNRVDAVSLFHAGPSVEGPVDQTSSARGRHVLCVSRHDFPKRTELFVLASRLASDIPAVAVGTGSRLGLLRLLDHRLTLNGSADAVDSRKVWCNNDPLIDAKTVDVPETNLHFAGSVSDAELERYYRDAICVVAPALLEDYGLTVIEAMRYGKPLIVCNDGGHLCHLVEDGVTGLVVEPTGRAIADAMRFLVDNPDVADAMGRRGREVAATFTWSRAMREFEAAIEATLA